MGRSKNPRQCKKVCKQKAMIRDNATKLSSEKCFKLFDKQKTLNDHMRCPRIKKIKCDNCPAVLLNASEQKKHNNHVHLKLKQFTCKTCNKEFGLKTNMERHEKLVHQKFKDFKCTNCGNRFGTKCHLEN